MNICSCMSKITMIIFIKTRSVLMKSLIDRYVALSRFMHKVHLHIQTTVQHSKKLSYQNPTGLKYKQLVSFKEIQKVAWIQSHHLHLQWKFKLWAGKFASGVMAKHNWAFFFKSLLTIPSNVLPLHLKQTFPPIV